MQKHLQVVPKHGNIGQNILVRLQWKTRYLDGRLNGVLIEDSEHDLCINAKKIRFNDCHMQMIIL